MSTPETPAPATPQPVVVDIQTLQAPNGVMVVAVAIQLPGAGISFSWCFGAEQARNIADALRKSAKTCESGIILPNSGIVPPAKAGN